MMKACLFYGPGDLRLQEVPTPTLGPGEVLVQVEVALTCGTDLKSYLRGHPVLLKSLPSPFGHECAGTVVQVGRGVEHIRAGMRVVAANSAPCRQCFYCRVGQTNLCEAMEFLNGAFAEQIKIPAAIVRENLLPIPPHLSARHAACCEQVACVLHALEEMKLEPGHQALILGSGSISLIFLQLLQERQVQVSVIGRSPWKLAKAKALGASAVLSLPEVLADHAVATSLSRSGQGADVVIEATGQPAMWELALHLSRRGGTVVFFGGCAADTSITVDTGMVHYGARTLLGVFHHTPQAIRAALDLIARQTLNLDDLITDEFPLSELKEAFNRMSAGHTLKAAIYP